MFTEPKQLAKEAIVVAILTIIFGTIASYLVSKSGLIPAKGNWNKYHAMEISLGLTGILVHLFCEFSGLNEYYVKIKR